MVSKTILAAVSSEKVGWSTAALKKTIPVTLATINVQNERSLCQHSCAGLSGPEPP